jgi:anti-sigma factor RsiW
VKEHDTDREADLHAAADGHLDSTDQARLDAWLASNPEDAAAVHAYRLQNARLHDRYDAVLSEPVPKYLLEVIGDHSSSARPGMSAWGMNLLRIAASLGLLFAGGVGGWILHSQMTSSPVAIVKAPDVDFPNVAMGAHRVFVAEVRHPVEVPASEEGHLVAWLSKRLGTTLRAPGLNDLGFSLVGGRLLADGNLPVAQFMYQDATGRRLTLYVRAADETTAANVAASTAVIKPRSGDTETAFHFVEHGGVSAFYWIDRSFAYALVAPLDRADLMAVATRAYTELAR